MMRILTHYDGHCWFIIKFQRACWKQMQGMNHKCSLFLDLGSSTIQCRFLFLVSTRRNEKDNRSGLTICSLYSSSETSSLGGSCHRDASTTPTRMPFQLSVIKFDKPPGKPDRISSLSRTSVKSATSLTVFPIPPRLSNVEEIEMTPWDDDEPTETFKAYRAARLAGVLIEPSVSVPIPKGLKPADMPTATPVDDPPGLCSAVAISFTHSGSGQWGFFSHGH